MKMHSNGPRPSAILIIFAFPLSYSFTAVVPVLPKHTQRSSSLLSVASLNTAWEWLAEERLSSGEDVYRDLVWIDPLLSNQIDTSISNSTTSLKGKTSQPQQSWNDVPLYPIPSVYLPVPGVNHTLNNIEPRNIQMAIDLLDSNGTDRIFCLALRASDTGRIAQTGTLMRLVHAEPQYSNYHYGTNEEEVTSKISKIIVTCVGLEPVRIDFIENGEEAESRRSKLMRSPVHLKASVSSQKSTAPPENAMDERTVVKLVEDYSFVRSMYLDGIGQDEIPHFARASIGKELPEWTADTFSTEDSFWVAAYTWQKLCNTVREARQLDLSADRNEIMIEVASQKDGPLKLPIHMEDLSPDIQRVLQHMEVDRQKEFALKCKMDPILDFLVLLQESTLQKRIRHLSSMVARERDRLTEAALFGGSRDDKNAGSSNQPRKGAWFDNDFCS